MSIMFLRKIYKTLIGFITCTIVVVLLVLILFPTFPENFLAFNEYIVTDLGHGSSGHFAVALLSLLVVTVFLPINLPDIFDLTNTLEIDLGIPDGFPFDSTGMIFLILGIWLIGAFAGGLASRGGLSSGAWSAMLSFIFLDLIFSIMVDAMGISIAGFTGSFFVVFLFTLVLGSFLFIPIAGLAGGIAGGILGKMLFRKTKDKISKDSSTSEE
ncbi:MAG: hypothetical protein KGD64_03195 [Candidatus Heimdallarchaeota archaeon]|nr:hypothetical protein [Candidatus Heimdallarchaeota archaeon]